MLAWILALLAWLTLALPYGGDAAPPPVEVEPGPPISVSPLPPEDVEPIEPSPPIVSPPGGIVPPPDRGHAPPITPGVPDPGEGRALTLAPIEALGLVVAESYPPQYALQVTSALPNGCARFEGYTLDRQGSTITIEVWNSVPTENVSCTMLYGYFPFTIELGSDFAPGQQVTVIVNGNPLEFVAQ